MLKLMIPLPLAVIIASQYCLTTPFQACGIMGRAAVLETIAFVVARYDPTTVRKATLGPPASGGHPFTPSTQPHLVALLRSLYPHDVPRIVTYDNKPFCRNTCSFGYQTVGDGGMERLARKYRIRSFYENCDDFEGSIKLMNWVNQQWQHGSKDSDLKDFDADIILGAVRHGERFWCRVYAMTLIQLAASAGVQSRLVSLSDDGYTRRHAVVEMWSNKYRHWFVLDPDFNIWYSMNGVPLNALEIHDALLSGQLQRIRVEKGEHRPQALESRIPRLYRLYRYFSVDMRNDWMTNRYFRGHPARSDAATVFWSDDRDRPVLNFERHATRRGDLYWDLNMVELSFRKGNTSCAASPSVAVDIATHTPDFSHFEIQRDKVALHTTSASTFQWPVHEGRNRLKVCAVSSSRRRGPPAEIVVDLVTQGH